ncbi:hypothetical protein quinque_013963 [Culex quinquefasciatus]
MLADAFRNARRLWLWNVEVVLFIAVAQQTRLTNRTIESAVPALTDHLKRKNPQCESVGGVHIQTKMILEVTLPEWQAPNQIPCTNILGNGKLAWNVIKLRQITTRKKENIVVNMAVALCCTLPQSRGGDSLTI